MSNEFSLKRVRPYRLVNFPSSGYNPWRKPDGEQPSFALNMEGHDDR